jgi:hypothetical protein
VSSFGGHSLLKIGPDEIRVYGLVLSRAVRVGSIQGGIAVRQRGGVEIEYLRVGPGVWTQSDDQYTRVLRLEVPAVRDLHGYEFSAPEAWEWVDTKDSVGAWYSLVEDAQTSPTSLGASAIDSERGCITAARHRALGGSLFTILLALGLSVRRLKA